MVIKKPKYYLVEEAARFLEIAPWTLRKWARMGKIKAHKVGKGYRIYEGEIKRILRD